VQLGLRVPGAVGGQGINTDLATPTPPALTADCPVPDSATLRSGNCAFGAVNDPYVIGCS
jgi:hypothetical protein